MCGSLGLAQVSIAQPLTILRHADTYTILVHLSFNPPTAAASKSSSSSQTILVDKCSISLVKRTLSRGGAALRPQQRTVEVRQQDIKLYAPGPDLTSAMSRVSTGGSDGTWAGARTPLAVELGGPGVDLELALNLQDESLSDKSGKRNTPLRDMGLSFRTPNVEMEVSRPVDSCACDIPADCASRAVYSLCRHLSARAGHHLRVPLAGAVARRRSGPSTGLRASGVHPDTSKYGRVTRVFELTRM